MAETPMQRLLASGEAAIIHQSEVDAFLCSSLGALLITGDPAQHPEADELAVIARELKRLSGGRLALGVVDFAADEAVKARLKITALPTVVFVKAGRVVATVPQLQEWAVYERAALAMFAKSEPKR